MLKNIFQELQKKEKEHKKLLELYKHTIKANDKSAKVLLHIIEKIEIDIKMLKRLYNIYYYYPEKKAIYPLKGEELVQLTKIASQLKLSFKILEHYECPLYIDDNIWGLNNSILIFDTSSLNNDWIIL